jgi:hypothetical protein
MLDELTWAPAGVFLATVVVLTTPFLGLIAVLVLLLATLAALTGVAITPLYLFGRFIHRHWHARSHSDEGSRTGAPAASTSALTGRR